MIKNILQTTKIIALAFALSIGLSFVYAWTAPTEMPPGGNTAAPINTSATAQVKNGGLSVNAFSAFANSYFAGNVGIGTTTSPAKLEVVGQVIIRDGTEGASKMLISTGEGIASWADIDEIINPFYCNEEPDLNTVNTVGWENIDVPGACMDETCSIKQEIRRKSNNDLVLVRKFEYYQNTDDLNRWWSSHNRVGNIINGDTGSSNIVPALYDSTILLRDDRTGTENLSQQWSFRDDNSSLYAKIYICGKKSLLDATQTISCPATPDINTQALNGYSLFTIPTNCKDETCVIKREINRASNNVLHESRLFEYFQNSGDNRWRSSQDAAFNKINGDGNSHNVVNPLFDSTILIRDDRTGNENSPHQWTIRDQNASYYMKTYICSVS